VAGSNSVVPLLGATTIALANGVAGAAGDSGSLVGGKKKRRKAELTAAEAALLQQQQRRLEQLRSEVAALHSKQQQLHAQMSRKAQASWLGCFPAWSDGWIVPGGGTDVGMRSAVLLEWSRWRMGHVEAGIDRARSAPPARLMCPCCRRPRKCVSS
jgi:hypothetical protein